MPEKPTRLVIAISGGVIRSVYADGPLEVHTLDWDEYGDQYDSNDAQIECSSEAEAEQIATDIWQRRGALVTLQGSVVAIDRRQFPREEF